jgi:hypothetical protein
MEKATHFWVAPVLILCFRKLLGRRAGSELVGCLRLREKCWFGSLEEYLTRYSRMLDGPVYG